MRSIARRAVLALSACLFAAGLVMAEVKSEKVTFYKNVTVNGTLLEKGEYKVTFDDHANELVIKKGGETVAKAPARAEMQEEKARRTQIYSTQVGDENVITGFTFAGEGYKIVIPEAGRAKAARE